jgi:hypothetical protein
VTTRTASCRCGKLKATATGEPVRVSVCHCLNCKKRSGSAFAMQARWPADKVTTEGQSKSWVNVADSGNRITFHFCPDRGSDVHYEIEGKFDGLVAIPLGAFDDPYFASPRFSVWEERSTNGCRFPATSSTPANRHCERSEAIQKSRSHEGTKAERKPRREAAKPSCLILLLRAFV